MDLHSPSLVLHSRLVIEQLDLRSLAVGRRIGLSVQTDVSDLAYLRLDIDCARLPPYWGTKVEGDPGYADEGWAL